MIGSSGRLTAARALARLSGPRMSASHPLQTCPRTPDKRSRGAYVRRTVALSVFWLAIATSMAGGAVLTFRLNRRLDRLKRLGLAPPSTPALWGSEARFTGPYWILSSGHRQIGDPIVTRLVTQLRWLISAQLAGILVWFATVSSALG